MFVIALLMTWPVWARAQEEMYFPSQNGSMIMLNPSFAGTSICPRVAYNFLWQQNNGRDSYFTSSWVADARIHRIASSVGMNASYDKGLGKNYNYGLNLIYVYDLELTRRLALKPGITAGFKTYSTERCSLSDRYELQWVPDSSFCERDQKTGFALGASILAYSENWFAGFAASNLCRPVETGFDGQSSRVPVKLNAIAGLAINIKRHQLMPTLSYEYQGKRYRFLDDTSFLLNPTQNLALNIAYNYKWLDAGIGARYIFDHDLSYHTQLGFQAGSFKFLYNVGLTPYDVPDAGIHYAFFQQIGLEYIFHCRPPHRRARSINCPSFGGGTGGGIGSNTYTNGWTSTYNMPASTENKANYNLISDGEIRPGTLTAGELNDFSKWILWKDVSSERLKTFQDAWKMNPQRRYSVQVLNEAGKSVIDAVVSLISDNEELIWRAHTDNTGRAELWSGIFGGTETDAAVLKVETNGHIYEFKEPKEFNEGMNIVRIPEECIRPNKADILFVVDATGSMGDEISYLKVELQDIIAQVAAQHPQVELRTGSMVYRCYSNEYVTRKSELTGDINTTTEFIKAQQSGEGGDEVVEVALNEAVHNFDWSKEAVARLVFFVCDEPPSEGDHTRALQEAITDASEMGIRFIPIVASGFNGSETSLEYLMRCVALGTNGTYVFLTDHSGVGDKHTDPTTDAFDVEFLNKLIPRLISNYVKTNACSEDEANEPISDTITVEIIEHVVLDSALAASFGQSESVKEVAMSPTNMEAPEQQPQPRDTIIHKNMRFYPNPTTGPVTVEFEGAFKEIFLYDINGRILERFNCEGLETVQIDLGRYPAGMYLLGCGQTGKIIKQ
jgi:hypothetical protein